MKKLREKVTYTPIHELIGEILTKTGYGLYAGAMPGGAQRRANLQMLVEKAMEYESTSYRGLFNFIRYVEQCRNIRWILVRSISVENRKIRCGS